MIRFLASAIETNSSSVNKERFEESYRETVGTIFTSLFIPSTNNFVLYLSTNFFRGSPHVSLNSLCFWHWPVKVSSTDRLDKSFLTFLFFRDDLSPTSRARWWKYEVLINWVNVAITKSIRKTGGALDSLRGCIIGAARKCGEIQTKTPNDFVHRIRRNVYNMDIYRSTNIWGILVNRFQAKFLLL